MVYATALAAILFYAANVPLCIALSLRLGDGTHFGFGFAVFRGSSALIRANAWEPKPPKKTRKKRDLRGKKLPIRFLLNALLALIKRIDRVRVRARIGTGDAAATALVCGALGALLGNFAEAEVSPSFDKAQLEFTGIIEIRAGNIIRAMASAGIESRPKEEKTERKN